MPAPPVLPKNMDNKLDQIIDRLRQFYLQHPWRIRVLNWAKVHSFPGLQEIPIYNLVVFINRETQEDAIVTRANSMSFSFFMAIFPSIIVLFTLLAYTPLYTNFDIVLHTSIQQMLPGQAGEMLFKTIQDIATIPRGGLLSLGFFLSFWFASNGMLSMMLGWRKMPTLMPWMRLR